MTEPTPEQMVMITNAIAAGRKIEAIKLYRSAAGSDLKDSKNFIETLSVSLQKSDPIRFPLKSGSGCMSVVLVFATVAGVMFGLLSCRSLGWTALNREIHGKFPTVKRIQTEELAKWLDDKQKAPPVLLDIRTTPEFAVSHLRGAIRVEPGSNPQQINLPKDTPIVAYCSVGYRSAQFAQSMGYVGYTHVSNLEGSIFMWANEGRPMMSGSKVVTKVHPYDATWGMLLKPSVRAHK